MIWASYVEKVTIYTQLVRFFLFFFFFWCIESKFKLALVSIDWLIDCFYNIKRDNNLTSFNLIYTTDISVAKNKLSIY